MAIKEFKKYEEKIKVLQNRKLIFREDILRKALTEYNYFQLINGFETVLIKSKNPKLYDKININDFINLHTFEMNLRFIISKNIYYLEEKLKNSISYHFCEKYCSTISDTMQYTNISNFKNPNSISIYPFSKGGENYYNIKHDFSKFLLFSRSYLKNLISKNDHIKPGFYRDSTYIPPSGVSVYSSDNTVAVPFWVAIETLTLGEIERLLHYLEDDIFEKVLFDFGFKMSNRFSKKFIFLNMINIIYHLRNGCAHTVLINRFRTPFKCKIDKSLVGNFNLNCLNRSPNSVLKLYDVLKILFYFTDSSEIKKLFSKFYFGNYIKYGMKKGKKINHNMLGRMGESEFKKWKNEVFSKKYEIK